MLREFTMEHYEQAMALWQGTPGVGMTDADKPEATAEFLARNPGCSFAWEQDGQLVGTALCGHDGRRGYVYHVVVLPAYRGRGIGYAMVDACRAALRARGITRCHVFVFADNAVGNGFWARRWRRRHDIVVYTSDT